MDVQLINNQSMHKYFERIKPLLEQLGCKNFKSYGWWSMDFTSSAGSMFHIMITPLLHRIYLSKTGAGDLANWETIDPCLSELPGHFPQISDKKEVANG